MGGSTVLLAPPLMHIESFDLQLKPFDTDHIQSFVAFK
jgi:hypothetical protein